MMGSLSLLKFTKKIKNKIYFFEKVNVQKRMLKEIFLCLYF